MKGLEFFGSPKHQIYSDSIINLSYAAKFYASHFIIWKQGLLVFIFHHGHQFHKYFLHVADPTQGLESDC